ncbi:unnamed protein product [Vitrella brassicaformis CCMP3155]|uniref:Uncharacterized protein n=1 Tax=Vitrella brassicaformis (strain CCMP3155) TaxID=1169540 RepID=A0A0G4EK69_VITBC|nr:unnamed protein product [Vitrella brassicaformis CCMP3155]|eukprot:CEL96922.1 unnamed protein product [Vitrella brassicaformis CCMP3155]
MMMEFAAALVGLVALVSSVIAEEAFVSPPAALPAPLRRLRQSSVPRMAVDISKGINGAIKRWREAELKHGRVCMLAALGMLVQENFNPLFDGKITGPAINHFQQVPFPFQAIIVAGIFGIEAYSIRRGWAKPRSNKLFVLRKDYEAGNLGFDPFNLEPDTEDAFNDLRAKELNNGRLAMIAVAGIVAQELVDGQEILEHLGVTTG